jgi:CheY-like chemotaxis protein
LALEAESRQNFNLSKAKVMLVYDTEIGLSILTQIVKGLGAQALVRCESIQQAQDAISGDMIDLAIVDGFAGGGRGYELVRWIRTATQPPTCYMPILVTTGLARDEDVMRTRDSGGNIIIRKPISPATLLQRIVWVARGGRQFLFADSYTGPDRRFRDRGPPSEGGRRKDDADAVDLEGIG